MDLTEYLLTFGSMGEVGRFRPARPVRCRRGEKAVVESCRGLELGEVLCLATPGHARHFVNTSVGKLLRPANADDELLATQMQARAGRLLEDSLQLSTDWGLSLEILDVEVLLDGAHAVLHHLSNSAFDDEPLVRRLSERHAVTLTLHNLAAPPPLDFHEEAGCGSCGSLGEGGCGSCSSGGCGSCAHDSTTAVRPVATSNLTPAHFAALRQQMEFHQRTPLL